MIVSKWMDIICFCDNNNESILIGWKQVILNRNINIVLNGLITVSDCRYRTLTNDFEAIKNKMTTFIKECYCVE